MPDAGRARDHPLHAARERGGGHRGLGPVPHRQRRDRDARPARVRRRLGAHAGAPRLQPRLERDRKGGERERPCSGALAVRRRVRRVEAGRVPGRVEAAMNARDIDAFVELFHEDYDSEQPAHPDRAFKGREQVRENWSAIFEGVPDFNSELVRSVVDGDVVWSEWRWRGTQADGGKLDMAGVIVFGVRDGRLAWARLYVEPVEQGAGIEAAVRGMSREED